MGAILAARGTIRRFRIRLTSRLGPTHAGDGPLPTTTRRARGTGTIAALLLPVLLLAACAGAPQPPRTSAESAPGTSVPRENIGRFPIEHYDQNVDHWIRPDAPGHDRPLLSSQAQARRFEAFRARYFGTGPRDPSPWNGIWLTASLLDAASLQQIGDSQARRVRRFDNGATGVRKTYGENFQPHTVAWIRTIEANMALSQLDPDRATSGYDARRRGITVDNALVRQLPTNDPAFYDFREAGEGYPFDALQDSALRPGTPVYTLARSVDGAWLLVYSPDLIGWVDARTVASVDERFVTTWRSAALQRLGAIVRANTPLADAAADAPAPIYRTFAPIGTVLPLIRAADGRQAAMFPVADIERRAQIRTAALDTDTFVAMPWTLTPRHLAQVMKQQIGRPYGWGNTLFYNDCSAETRSLFAPFGVWLPRHSSDQLRAGKRTDLRHADIDTRLRTLSEQGRPLMTLIHINGHIMLYLGNAQRDGESVPMTYQNVWGLSPADNSRRNVIGGSVILPLLKTYPEDPQARSLAGKPLFEISVIGAEDAAGQPRGEAMRAPGLDSQEEMPQ
ncbi:hydrolase [Pandoraea morbifera]|uniref:Hydrolase n=1 Tax=Pandoraea morbifera TaxID=2508300 RepID=A0A5E4TQH9_9BURK|nr:SH3 domain-containing C40 family peptidase [Pandoraea morbifera]VVD90037.1 hydrolase [Pandoraea morbifera]